MFNKGKATLIAVLSSIAILILTILVEILFPFEEVFNIPPSSGYTNRIIGWHLVWLIPLIYLFYKNKAGDNSKETNRILIADISFFLIMTNIGLPKFIYDIQKQRALKKGIVDTEKGLFLYVFSLLFYTAFICCIIALALFARFQASRMESLNRYISETLSLLSEGQMECAERLRPDFVSSCSAHIEQSRAILDMQFNQDPFWLYGAEWTEGIHAKVNGRSIRIILE